MKSNIDLTEDRVFFKRQPFRNSNRKITLPNLDIEKNENIDISNREYIYDIDNCDCCGRRKLPNSTLCSKCERELSEDLHKISIL